MSLPHARRTRYRLLAWVVPSCFLAVVLRLVWLHWVDAPRLRAEALQARRVLQEKPCRRGDIRDAQDNLLALSEDVWDIGVDPDVLTKADRERAAEVAVALGLPAAKVRLAFDTTVRTDAAGEEHRIRWSILAREAGEGGLSGRQLRRLFPQATVAHVLPPPASSCPSSSFGPGARVARYWST